MDNSGVRVPWVVIVGAAWVAAVTLLVWVTWFGGPHIATHWAMVDAAAAAAWTLAVVVRSHEGRQAAELEAAIKRIEETVHHEAESTVEAVGLHAKFDRHLRSISRG